MKFYRRFEDTELIVEIVREEYVFGGWYYACMRTYKDTGEKFSRNFKSRKEALAACEELVNFYGMLEVK